MPSWQEMVLEIIILDLMLLIPTETIIFIHFGMENLQCRCKKEGFNSKGHNVLMAILYSE